MCLTKDDTVEYVVVVVVVVTEDMHHTVHSKEAGLNFHVQQQFPPPNFPSVKL